ncbi:MAG: hypothetical protein II802_02310, partial [Clostridia bacterium]|nr:hypothetical protein [Clostridia bacterium]
AKEMGSKLDIDVFFGIEEVYEQGKEVLIYGISPELLADHPEFKDMRMPEIYKFVHANNGFISVAHPFRHVSYIPEPDKEPDVRYFDAVEVYNHSNSQEDNQKAYDFAKRNSLQTVSGGDIHIADKFGKSGLAFYERLYTPQNFVKALKENRYKLIINGEISE